MTLRTIECPYCHVERQVRIVGEGGGSSGFYDEADEQCPSCGKWDDEPVQQAEEQDETVIDTLKQRVERVHTDGQPHEGGEEEKVAQDAECESHSLPSYGMGDPSGPGCPWLAGRSARFAV